MIFFFFILISFIETDPKNWTQIWEWPLIKAAHIHLQRGSSNDHFGIVYALNIIIKPTSLFFQPNILLTADFHTNKNNILKMEKSNVDIAYNSCSYVIRLLVLEHTSSICTIHSIPLYAKHFFLVKRKFELLIILEWNEESRGKKNSRIFCWLSPLSAHFFCPWFVKKYMDANFNAIFLLFSPVIKLILFMYVFPSKWALTLQMVNIHQSQSMLCMFTTFNNEQ